MGVPNFVQLLLQDSPITHPNPQTSTPQNKPSTTAGFDIANHWSEWAADYHSDTPSVLDFSRLPRPDQQAAFVDAYLRGLLAALGLEAAGATAAADAATAGGEATNGGSEQSKTSSGGGAAAGEPGGADSQSLRSVWCWLRRHGVRRGATKVVPPAAFASLHAELLAAARGYGCVANLVWALWGLIQARDSVCPDFDYLDYAGQKWRQYCQTAPAGIRRRPPAAA